MEFPCNLFGVNRTGNRRYIMRQKDWGEQIYQVNIVVINPQKRAEFPYPTNVEKEKALMAWSNVLNGHGFILSKQTT